MAGLFDFSPTQAPLADELPYWGFAAPDVLLTRAGDLMFAGEVYPRGVDALEPKQLDSVTQAWQKLFAAVSPPARAYVVSIRHPLVRQEREVSREEAADIGALVQRKRDSWVTEHARAYRVFLVVLFEPRLAQAVSVDQHRWWLEYIRRWSGARRVSHLTVYLRAALEEAISTSRAQWAVLSALVDDSTPIRQLSGNALLSVLYRLLNHRGDGFVPMPKLKRYGLAARLADDTIAFERSHMLLGDRLVGLYSLALPPRAISANGLGALYSLPWEFSSILEWRPLEKSAVAGRIRGVQKHFNNLRFSFWSAMNQTEGTDMAVEDAPAAESVHQLDRAALELTTHGVPYGEVSFSFAVTAHDRKELDQAGAELNRVFTELDGKVVRERYGQAAVWFQRLPGQRRQPFVRPLLLSSGQVACMAPLFGEVRGYPKCKHLDGPPLTSFVTRWHTVYNYDLFAGRDVGHTLVLGATGSGKSFLLNFFLMHSLQYKPKILILDLGGSYRALTDFVGGSYLSMSAGEEDGGGGEPTRLRPFSLAANERTYSFLVSWVCKLLEIGGYTAKSEDLNDIRERIRDVYEYPPDQRTLGQLRRMLPAEMWPAMSRWVDDGPWAATFDGPPPEKDTSIDDDWQVVDLAGALKHEDWCTAALFFLFEKLRLSIDDESSLNRLKLLVVDEGWRFLADPAVLEALLEAAKTWRKRNAALVIATQSVEDLSSSSRARALLESIPSRLFLANPDFPATAAEFLHLTDGQYETIRQLEPKHEVFLLRALEQVVLRLRVDAESYWLYTSSPTEAARRTEMVRRYGLVAAVQRLAAGLGVDDAGPQAGRKALVA